MKENLIRNLDKNTENINIHNFNFTSPLNVSLKRYKEVDKLLPYINLRGIHSFVDINISDGLLLNYMFNLGFSKYTMVFCYNKYINAFWKYYFIDSNLLLDTVLRFYEKYYKINEYYPFYLIKKIKEEADFDLAVKYLLTNSYLLNTNYKFNINTIKPEQSFNINELAFRYNLFPMELFVYKEFDKFANNGYFRFKNNFIYGNLGNIGMHRVIKYFNKLKYKYNLMLQTKEEYDIIEYKLDNRILKKKKFNNEYLYLNYNYEY